MPAPLLGNLCSHGDREEKTIVSIYSMPKNERDDFT